MIPNRDVSVFLAFSILLSIAFGTAAPAEEIDILIDKVHANDYSEIGLVPHEYSYHRISGFRLGFDYLRHEGIRVADHTEGRLTDEKLARCRLLFINLVSAERPPFYVSEINAIKRFLTNGGSLFLITDHSNAYFHAWRLAPLLDELGIDVSTETACDHPSHSVGTGNGWIRIERFDRHPVTSGLQQIVFQTGGCVDERFAVAWTSDDAWGDDWRAAPYAEKNEMGFYGNWTRDPEERIGPLGTVLAKEFGKGRIVIVADQNIFSDAYIDYSDNYRLWINAMDWLLQSRYPKLSDPAQYRAFRKPKILFAEDFRQGDFGSNDPMGLYHAVTWLRRFYPAMTDNRYEEEYELIVLPFGGFQTENAIVNFSEKHLRRGKPILVLNTEPDGIDIQPDSVLLRIFQKVGPAKPTFETFGENLYRVKTDSGGWVYLLSTRVAVVNDRFPSPTKEPSSEDLTKAEMLRKEFERILTQP